VADVTISAKLLRVIICDSDRVAGAQLRLELSHNRWVGAIYDADSIAAAKTILADGNADVVFLDLFGFGLYESYDFIAAVRRKYPEVVFALHADDSMFEEKKSFFDGVRSRLPDYYRLARHQEGVDRTVALQKVLEHCLFDLGYSVPEDLSGCQDHSCAADPRGISRIEECSLSVDPGETWPHLALNLVARTRTDFSNWLTSSL